MRNLVEVWVKLGMHDHHSSDYVSGQGVGPWYAVNDTAIVRCAWRYVCVTGDFAWLDKKVGDRTILGISRIPRAVLEEARPRRRWTRRLRHHREPAGSCKHLPA